MFRAIHQLLLALWVGFGAHLFLLEGLAARVLGDRQAAERLFVAVEAQAEPYALGALPLLVVALRLGWEGHRLRFRTWTLIGLGLTLVANRFFVRPLWQRLEASFRAAAEAGAATEAALNQVHWAQEAVVVLTAAQVVLAAVLLVAGVAPGTSRRRTFISL
jgi:hypothetical protein